MYNFVYILLLLYFLWKSNTRQTLVTEISENSTILKIFCLRNSFLYLQFDYVSVHHKNGRIVIANGIIMKQRISITFIIIFINFSPNINEEKFQSLVIILFTQHIITLQYSVYYSGYQIYYRLYSFDDSGNIWMILNF
jgi:hypothetical protein